MTKNLENYLKKIADEIKKGVTLKPLTARELINLTGASKRGCNVNSRLRNALEKYELDTFPSFDRCFIDGYINFISSKCSDKRSESAPIYRIDSLSSANKVPLSVKPDSELSVAVTIMLANDFSQLPVMTTPKEVKGVISWKSIGMRLALGKVITYVRDAMETAQVIKSEDSLFDAIEIITKYDYVLIRSYDKVIMGLVTVSDLSFQFKELAEPFLLIGEVELCIRKLVHGKFSVEELSEVKHLGDVNRTVNGVADLTLGEFGRLLEIPENWRKVKLQIDKIEFIKRLNRVREIRNDVMHFDPQGIDNTSLQELQLFVSFLNELRRCGAF